MTYNREQIVERTDINTRLPVGTLSLHCNGWANEFL